MARDTKEAAAHRRRDLDYAKARELLEDRRSDAEDALCEALNAYRQQMTDSENQYLGELDAADRRYDRALRRRRKR